MTVGAIINELKNVNRKLSANDYQLLGRIIDGNNDTEIFDYTTLIDKIKNSEYFDKEKIDDMTTKDELIKYFRKFHDTKSEIGNISTEASLKNNIDIFKIKNLLLKGVPGTGKSHIIDNIIKYNLGLKDKPNNILRINIHSASSNADLMQGISISTKNNQVSYEEKQGLVFKHIKDACYNPYEPFVLVLEEIQENSLNELIGDLIYLCEDKKRTKIHELESSIFNKDEYEYQELIKLYVEEIKKLQRKNEEKESVHTVKIPNLVTTGENRELIMPDNFYIFCTSNYRDDKKVIEDNLLRRFDVIEVYPKYKDTLKKEFISEKVSAFLEKLNTDIYEIFEGQKEIHPDRFLIGHSNWLDVENIGDDKFYKALLKVVVEFKEIREVDYEIVKKLFEDIIKDYSLELNSESYKDLVSSLQEKVYLNILNCTEEYSKKHTSNQE